MNGIKSFLRPDGVYELIFCPKNPGNRFDADVLAELSASLLAAEAAQPKALLLSHEGDVFCLGGNLGDARKQDSTSIRRFADLLSKVLFQLFYFPVPVVAAIEGDVEGGGISIIQACDMVAAAHTAHFGIPEMEAGMAPVISMSGARRVIPEKRMLKMAYLAERATAQEAENWGLITEAVAHGAARETCEQWIANFAAKNPSSISTIRRLRRDLDGGEYFRQINAAAAILPSNLLSNETRDMLDKRDRGE